MMLIASSPSFYYANSKSEQPPEKQVNLLRLNVLHLVGIRQFQSLHFTQTIMTLKPDPVDWGRL